MTNDNTLLGDNVLQPSRGLSAPVSQLRTTVLLEKRLGRANWGGKQVLTMWDARIFQELPESTMAGDWDLPIHDFGHACVAKAKIVCIYIYIYV